MNETKAPRKPKTIAAVIVVFLAGMLVGGFLAATLMRSHLLNVIRRDRPPVHEMVAKRLTGDLALTDAQQGELEAILLEYAPRFEEFERTSREQVRSIAQEMESRIRSILTPQQQQIFDRNLARMHERFSHREGRKKHDYR